MHSRNIIIAQHGLLVKCKFVRGLVYDIAVSFLEVFRQYLCMSEYHYYEMKPVRERGRRVHGRVRGRRAESARARGRGESAGGNREHAREEREKSAEKRERRGHRGIKDTTYLFFLTACMPASWQIAVISAALILSGLETSLGVKMLRQKKKKNKPLALALLTPLS